MDTEIWKCVPGWPEYEASSRGRFRRNGRILKPSPMVNGYLSVRFSKDGVAKSMTAHSVVAATFHGPRPEGMDVSHLDGTRTNNAADNLVYESRRDNIHRYRYGAPLPPPDPVLRAPLTLEDLTVPALEDLPG